MLTQAAMSYHRAGLCVLPARRAEKRPIVGRWKQYRQTRPTEAELSAWMANPRNPRNNPDAVCIVCGAASNNVEIIDFDAGGELFSAWGQRIEADLHDRLVVEVTPSGGYHVIYRCDVAICGNLKLAQRKVGDTIATLIETRGEGGLFLCAPTAGYEVIQGDLCNLPVLTEAQRDALLQAAWELNEYLPPVVDGPRKPSHNSGIGHVGQRAALLAENGVLCVDMARPGDCSSHSGAVVQRSPSSVEQAECSSENAVPDQCSPHSAAVGQRAPSSVEQSDGAAEISHIGGCRSNNAAVGPTGPLSAPQCGDITDNADRPGDDFNTRGDPRSVLAQHGWVRVKGGGSGGNEYWRRPGKTSGWSASLKDGIFYVFSANAAPFEPNRGYSPFAVYTLLNHGGDWAQAAGSLRMSGYGGQPGHCLTHSADGVDISAIVQMSAAPGAYASDSPGSGQTTALCDGQAAPMAEIADPGPMPADMLRVPGFVSEVMDHCLATAPYPNQVMAFAGALSLLAFLAGRKVRDSGDNRTNIYLLGLAHSASGKDWPRKINTRIVNQIGLADALGERFASGEGIQDALFQSPSMLFQTDEIDGMLQSINKAKDARHEAVMSTLLTMFSSSNSVFPMRRKAGTSGPGKSPGVIDQPCLVIFGTAIPNHYYEALSERMLTNGFFARMIILEAGQRGSGQEPSICELPQRVMATAKWWSEFHPGDHRANLIDVHPVPAIVRYTDQARRLLIETREEAETEYAEAEAKSDSVGTTVWGRVSEQTRKLALLYAISENHESPSIGIEAVRWASRFAMHQTRRMLFMAAGHVAENPFHAECLKLIRKLRESSNGQMARNHLMRVMRCKQADFDQILGTLLLQGDIVPVEIPTKTKTAQGYRLP